VSNGVNAEVNCNVDLSFSKVVMQRVMMGLDCACRIEIMRTKAFNAERLFWTYVYCSLGYKLWSRT